MHCRRVFHYIFSSGPEAEPYMKFSQMEPYFLKTSLYISPCHFYLLPAEKVSVFLKIGTRSRNHLQVYIYFPLLPISAISFSCLQASSLLSGTDETASHMQDRP